MFRTLLKTGFELSHFAEKRRCFKVPEGDPEPLWTDPKKKPAEEEKPKPKEKAPEQPKPKGVPIDTEPKKDEQKEKARAAAVAKENMTEAEKKIAAKYGGAIYEMDKQPDCKEKGYKDQVYVNVPKDLEKFVGPDGQPKKPRIIYYFHGNGGSIGDSTGNIMHMVEEMRAKGDPVILVMPQDRNGHWKDYDKPDAFKDVMKMAQQITGVPVSPDISLASHSGGYQGIGKVITKLKSQSESDPEAKELYSRIKQIALFDSAYGFHDEFAEWATDKNHSFSSNYTDHLQDSNRRIEEAIRTARGGDMTGIRFEPVKGNHGDAPQVFAEFLKEGSIKTSAGPAEGSEKPPVATASLNIPERSKEALTGKELKAAWERCKTDEERMRLAMDQWAKGNVPESYRKGFRKVTIEKNGEKLEVMVAPSGVRFGTDDDFYEFPVNGPMAEANAQAAGGTLPNQWLVDRVDEDNKKNSQFIPFKAQVFSKEDANHMRSPEFIDVHNKHTIEWAKAHGIDLSKPTYGYYKQVVLQSPSQRQNNRLDIYGGHFEKLSKKGEHTGEPGDTVEPGGVGHDIYHWDYSQQQQLVLAWGWRNGKPVLVRDVLADPDFAKAMGFPPIPKDQSYQLSDETTEAIARIRKQLPAGAPPLELVAVAAPEKPKAEEKPEAPAKPEEKPAPKPQPELPPEQVAAIPDATEVKAWKPAETKGEAVAVAPTKAKTSSPKSAPATYAAAPSYAPPTGGYEPASYSPPVSPGGLAIKPEKLAEPAPEGLDAPPTIHYTTLGDSITVGTTMAARGALTKLGYHERQSKEQPANKEMVGKTTSYMKGRLDEEVIPSIEKNGLKAIVMGGGGNDILGPLKDDEAMEKTKKRVTDNLAEMYQKAHDNGLKVVAMTMPPFNRFIEKTFTDPAEKERHYQLWNDVNQFIIDQEGKTNGPDKVVRAHELVGELNEDKRWLVRSEMSAGDGLHLTGAGYISIQREVEKALNTIAAEMAAAEPKPQELPDPPKQPPEEKPEPVVVAPPAKPVEPPKVAAEPLPPGVTPKDYVPEAVDPNPNDVDSLTKTPSIETGLVSDITQIKAQMSEIHKRIPAGYGPPTEVTREVALLARGFLKAKPFGTITPFMSGGKEYLAVKEWHYHDPATNVPPPGWHHGVSIFEKRSGGEVA